MLTPAVVACQFWLHDVAATIFTVPQVQEFLDLCQTNDAAGLVPGATGYVPTYDVIRAAGYGWLWMAGMVGNKAVSYKIGDVSITVDKNYCNQRARELMASASDTALRRDEDVVADVSARRRV